MLRMQVEPNTLTDATSSSFACILFCLLFVFLYSGSSAVAHPAEGRYSTMGRATAATVGNMLLQSRMRSSSNPNITTPHISAEDAEVNNIMSFKVQRNSPN